MCTEVSTALFRGYSTIKQSYTDIFNRRRETDSVLDENRKNAESLPSQNRLESISIGMEKESKEIVIIDLSTR
jgi:hypothetical protein